MKVSTAAINEVFWRKRDKKWTDRAIIISK